MSGTFFFPPSPLIKIVFFVSSGKNIPRDWLGPQALESNFIQYSTPKKKTKLKNGKMFPKTHSWIPTDLRLTSVLLHVPTARTNQSRGTSGEQLTSYPQSPWPPLSSSQTTVQLSSPCNSLAPALLGTRQGTTGHTAWHPGLPPLVEFGASTASAALR